MKKCQDKMKEVVARARDGAQVSVGMPSSYVAAKRAGLSSCRRFRRGRAAVLDFGGFRPRTRGLQRILEKTLEAEQERAGWDWPQREDSYVRHTYCFYILDTVRMSFVCQGRKSPIQMNTLQDS